MSPPAQLPDAHNGHAGLPLHLLAEAGERGGGGAKRQIHSRGCWRGGGWESKWPPSGHGSRTATWALNMNICVCV